jgi:hypothetical protein
MEISLPLREEVMGDPPRNSFSYGKVVSVLIPGLVIGRNPDCGG